MSRVATRALVQIGQEWRGRGDGAGRRAVVVQIHRKDLTVEMRPVSLLAEPTFMLLFPVLRRRWELVS